MERFSWTNIFRLGLKELRSLAADKVLLGLIVWAFSGAIYEAATGSSQQVNNAPVAIVDEDARRFRHSSSGRSIRHTSGRRSGSRSTRSMRR